MGETNGVDLEMRASAWRAVPDARGTPVFDETAPAGCQRNYPVIPNRDRRATTGQLPRDQRDVPVRGPGREDEHLAAARAV